MNEQTQKEEPQKKTLSEAGLRYWAGRGLLNEEGVDPEGERARLGAALLLQAANMGHTEAKREYGDLHFLGYGVPLDCEKGLAILREAVADGSEAAEMDLARRLVRPPRIPKDAEILREGALVLWHERHDLAAANLLMSRAARMSFVPAMKDYAQMLREGIGCEKDPHLAADIEWQAEELAKGR